MHSGRRSPVEIKGSEYVLPVDMVVMSIGQGPNPLIKATTPNLETNKRGNINADESGQTSMPGVFAGGDIVTGAPLAVNGTSTFCPHMKLAPDLSLKEGIETILKTMAKK